MTVPTTSDTIDEPNGPVTLTLTAGTGYTLGSPSSATVTVSDDDDAPAALSVFIDDAEGQEGRDVAFTVRLSAPAPNYAFVYVKLRKTSPASARAGVDYEDWRRPRVVIIYKGKSERQVSVRTYQDAHDEGNETFELVVTEAMVNSTDGRNGSHRLPVVDGVAIGTITNDDPLPAAYLARFGRTVAEQALDGIAGRIAAHRAPGLEGTFAGQALAFGPPAPDDAADPLDPSPALTAEEALLGARFALAGQPDGAGGTLAVWGQASQGRFDGAERGDGTDITLDGTVTAAMLGADYARGDWLFGLALTQTSSEGSYASLGEDDPCPDGQGVLCDGAVRAGDGDIKASLTAAVPYAALDATPRLKLWGAAGVGAGEVTLKTMDAHYRADTSWTMAAAGLRGTLLAPPTEGSGPTLALTSDALWARTSSDRTRDLAASDADVTRLRLGVEGSYRLAFDGDSHLTPTLEAGARHDGGDAETGLGVELGGGIAWVHSRLGLSLDFSGRTLVAHEDDDLKDRGLAAAFTFDPDPATERGPSFSLRQAVGGQAQGGLEALFAPDPLEERTAGETTSRWAMEAAWGFPALGGRFTASPHAGLGLGLGAGARDYTLGWRLAPQAATAPDLSLGVRATRRESETAEPEHRVGVEATVRW